jgi:hypothetical protein
VKEFKETLEDALRNYYGDGFRAHQYRSVHVLLVFWEEIKEEEWGIIEISEWIEVCGQLHKSLSFNRHCRLIVVVV